MATIDLKKAYKEHYSAKADHPVVVEVPARPYLMIDGAGDPNTSAAYRGAIESIYPLAYGIRAAVKDATGDAFVVMPLEGLWWVPDMRQFSLEDKSAWLWTAMICLPDAVTQAMVDEVLPAITSKRRLPAGAEARVEYFGDGLSVQVLHVGPYESEGATIQALHRFIDERGYSLVGKHHEIYLSDQRKVAPPNLRTIIRQPVVDS